MPDSIHHTERMVSALTENVSSLAGAGSELMTIASGWDRRASEDRTHIMDVIGSIKSSIESLKFSIEKLDDKHELMAGTVAQQANIIRSFEDERQQRLGAQKMGKVMGGGVATIAGAGGAGLLHLFEYLNKK